MSAGTLPEAAACGTLVEHEPLLRIEDLAVSFSRAGSDRARAVDGVSLTVFPRQTVAVVGESGCGKSVTAMSLLQLLPRPQARVERGRALFRSERGERDLLALPAHEIRRVRGNEIAMIFQEPMTSLNPVYTVGEQIVEAVRLHQRVSPKSARDAAVRAMRDVRIPDAEGRLSAYPHEFSGGMRQRVMIAMALACRPRLLIADEPTTALDVTVQAQILVLLRSLQRERQMSILLITHDLGVVAENADVVCVMYAGRVVEYARVFDLFERPMHPYTRGLLQSIPRVSQRRERLVTIQESVNTSNAFDVTDTRGRTLRAWWPGKAGTGGAPAVADEMSGYALVEAEPEHWVGVWGTPAARECPATHPALNFRAPVDDMRTDAGAT